MCLLIKFNKYYILYILINEEFIPKLPMLLKVNVEPVKSLALNLLLFANEIILWISTAISWIDKFWTFLIFGTTRPYQD
jgi:hypothetical protein